MKIQLGQLRRIIREVLREQATVPGKWDPRKGEPVDQDDLDTMSSAGLGRRTRDEEDLYELDVQEGDSGGNKIKNQ